MVYEELDKLITEMSGENASDDYWYDVGVTDAMNLLEKFSETNWELLGENIIDKSLEWQRKLAYCLDNECNMYELNILISLLSTTDDELFEICIDTLRSFTNQESKKMILDNPLILQRVNNLLLHTSSLPVKKMLQDFLSKIHS
ncbi:hypothetical protein D3P09_06900 [Paenibacillus pinisoli]|uniref:Immunity protein 30 domain-containing protein n=2 Tax=Paenibacillus pinisoli TaxID=1276110 RepID=A0A3A6Q3F3_9BACL|nr:hypothetical protein D3P09_06900 [Paenibacillus pinisoli]